jgi:hypothetical protein
MPKTTKKVDKEGVSFRLSKDVLTLVDSLIGTIHGDTRAAVVQSLMKDQLKKIFPTGRLPKA